MSVKVMGRVWDLPLQPDEKFLLLAMADHADHDGGNIFPGNQRLVEKTGFHERKLQRLIKRFLESGILTIDDREKGGRGMHRVYRMHTEKGDAHVTLFGSQNPDTSVTLSIEETMTPVSPFSEKRVTPETEKGDKTDSKRVTPETEKGDIHTRANQEPSINHQSEPSGNRHLPRNGPAQEMVSNLCAVLDIDKPTNYSKAVGQAELLVKAGSTPAEVKDIATWLQSDPFWSQKGIDMGTVMSQRDKWRASRNAPPSPSNVKPFQKRYETPMDRTTAAFEAFYAEVDGMAPDPYADHDVIDVKVSGK